jgi:hypothetical protein
MADTSRQRQESLELPRMGDSRTLQCEHYGGDFEAQPNQRMMVWILEPPRPMDWKPRRGPQPMLTH